MTYAVTIQHLQTPANEECAQQRKENNFVEALRRTQEETQGCYCIVS
jgi:hypothetical protein